MREKELKKLNRRELLEMLLEQSRDMKALQDELNQTKKQLAQAQDKMETHRLELTNAGSIADAALRLNDIFERAQKAADDYLAGVKNISAGGEFEEDFDEDYDDRGYDRHREQERDAQRRVQGSAVPQPPVYAAPEPSAKPQGVPVNTAPDPVYAQPSGQQALRPTKFAEPEEEQPALRPTKFAEPEEEQPALRPTKFAEPEEEQPALRPTKFAEPEEEQPEERHPVFEQPSVQEERPQGRESGEADREETSRRDGSERRGGRRRERLSRAKSLLDDIAETLPPKPAEQEFFDTGNIADRRKGNGNES